MEEIVCFSFVLEAMKMGQRAKRPGWTGYISIYKPLASDVMNHDYIYAKCAGGEIIPAVITQLDMLAEDWVVFD